jgi:hypothetical protein
MGNELQTPKRSHPVLQALLLADHIYTDQSGKRVICGTFSRIFCSQFPTLTSFSCFAFVLLVDVVGEVELQLRLVSLDDNEILMESSKAKIRSESPLTPLDIVFQIPPLPLPREGIYSFECWTDGTMIGSVRLKAGPLPTN